jgi:hypothetical protein
MKTNLFTLGAAASAVLLIQPAAAVLVAFEFETAGDTEGWSGSTAPANAAVTGFGQASALGGGPGVLTSTDVDIDPQIVRSGSAIASTAGESWTSVTIRFRQLSGNPQDAGTTSAPYDANGTILFFNNSTQNLGVGPLGTKTVAGGGAFAGDTYNLTLTGEADNWQVLNVDLTGAPTLNSAPFTAMRLDPVGNAAAKNFEVDYIRFQAAVPEPGSALLSGLAAGLLLLRRRR